MMKQLTKDIVAAPNSIPIIKGFDHFVPIGRIYMHTNPIDIPTKYKTGIAFMVLYHRSFLYKHYIDRRRRCQLVNS